MTDDLRDTLRAFLARTAYSQENIAQESRLSLKTVQNVVNGKPYSGETGDKIRRVLDRLMDAEDLGGIEYTVGVIRLRDDITDMRGRLDTLADTVQQLSLNLAILANHVNVDLPAHDGLNHS